MPRDRSMFLRRRNISREWSDCRRIEPTRLPGSLPPGSISGNYLLRGSELRFSRCLLVSRRFDGHFHGKVLPEPVVDAFFLTGVDNPLPPDVTGSFIIFRNDVRVPSQDGHNRILPKPTTVVRVVDYLAVLHELSIAEILLL